MRHRVTTKKLGRTPAHRDALLKNLSASLIDHGSIETTVAKAKALRPYVEKLITKAKRDTSYNAVRYLRKKLLTEGAIRKLLGTVAPKYKDVNGGYTRIVKTRNRAGDNTVMARIEFVATKKKTPKKKITKVKDEAKK